MEDIKVIGKYGDNGWEETGTVGVGAIARGLTVQNMADLLGDYLNTGMKDYREGVTVGRLCQRNHRTIQASIIRFCLGVIIGLSTPEKEGEKVWTDARNETPVAMGQEILRQIEAGELNMGWMI